MINYPILVLSGSNGCGIYAVSKVTILESRVRFHNPSGSWNEYRIATHDDKEDHDDKIFKILLESNSVEDFVRVAKSEGIPVYPSETITDLYNNFKEFIKNVELVKSRYLTTKNKTLL